jgi:hypothetical protein
MHIQQRIGTSRGLAMSLVMFTSLGLAAQTQKVTIEGLVTGRNGESMAVKTADTPRLTVILSDSTKATRVVFLEWEERIWASLPWFRACQ